MNINGLVLFKENGGAVYTCQISPMTEKFFATGGHDKKIRLWQTSAPYNNVSTFLGHRDAVTCLRWKNDESLLLSTSVDRTAVLWDVITGSALRTFSSHENIIHSCDMSTNLAVTCGDDSVLLIWDKRSKDYVASLQAKSPLTSCLIRGSDEKAVLFGGIEGSVTEYSLLNQSFIRIYPKQKCGLYNICESLNQKVISLSMMDNSVEILHRTPNLSYSRTFSLRDACAKDGEDIYVKHDMTSDGSQTSIGNSEKIHVWDCFTGSKVQTLKSFVGSVNQIQFSASASELAMCGLNGIACIGSLRKNA